MLLNATLQELIAIDRDRFNLLEAYISTVESPCIVSTLSRFPRTVLRVVSTPRVLYLSGYHTLFDSFRVPPRIPTYDIRPPREDAPTQRPLLTLGTFGRVPEGTCRPAVDTSNDDYYSTSLTSSGGSSARDLEAKAALWAEYQQRPAHVISRFESSAPRTRLPEDGADRVAETAAAGSRAPDDNVPKHELSCQRLCARWAHCDCSCKQLRLAQRQTHQQQHLGCWFSAQREEEGADDGDDEGDAPSNALPPSAV
ncbi:hypothetical protein B0H14DRAFT_3708927 [Mycena olivaceomarginata]|nr:hypothetical protein B0H14DRAFT_3708927 [Mycena olivaceomarginata]